jgi:hypothetical protein
VAIAFRGAGAAVFAFNAAATISLPAATADGDLVVVLCYLGTTPWTTPSGWTKYREDAASATTNSEGVCIMWKFWHTGDPTSVAFGPAASGSTIAVAYAYSGVINQTTPIVSDSGWVGTGTATNPQTFTQPSFSTSVDGSLVVGIGVVNSSMTYDTPTVAGVAATADAGPGAATASRSHYAWSKLLAVAGSTGTCSIRSTGSTAQAFSIVFAIQPPNPFTRLAYIFGARQAVSRAANF